MLMSKHQESRKKWAENRAIMEGLGKRSKPLRSGLYKKTSHFNRLVKTFSFLLGLTPLYKKGLHTASHPRLIEIDLVFDRLPKAFDGYKVLHMTDLHLDFMPGLTKKICNLVSQVDTDICLMTGDYLTFGGKNSYKKILDPMAEILSSIRHRDGIFATFGNHDTWEMARPFEEMGLTMLINETCEIVRQGESISLTGLDDPHDYYTPEAGQALCHSNDRFKIALIHTPELYDLAADNGYNLYLAGHTHGGQICLPGGIPIVLHLERGHRFSKGLWQYKKMIGYTGQGVGTVGIPIRLNTISEITLFTLHTRK